MPTTRAAAAAKRAGAASSKNAATPGKKRRIPQRRTTQLEDYVAALTADTLLSQPPSLPHQHHQRAGLPHHSDRHRGGGSDDDDDDDDDPQTGTRVVSAEAVSGASLTLATNVGRKLRGVSFAPDDPHSAIVTQLCATIAGAGSLGHRTCHCLWGPPGSGKRRVLGAIQEHFTNDARRRREFLVVEMHTEALASDDDAVALFFEALQGYYRDVILPGPGAGNPMGTCFHFAGVSKALSRLFESVLPEVLRRQAEGGSDDLSGDLAGTLATMALHGQVSSSHSTRLFTSAGTTALDALQQALVAANQAGLSLVVLVSDIERFATWCDRVAYMVSGIMHECVERAGGVSLLCASTSGDFSLEKRLSSRLCCEVWHCPPMRVQLRSVFRDAAADGGKDLVEESGCLLHELASILQNEDDHWFSAYLAELDRKAEEFGYSAHHQRSLAMLLATSVPITTLVDRKTGRRPTIEALVAAQSVSPLEQLLGDTLQEQEESVSEHQSREAAAPASASTAFPLVALREDRRLRLPREVTILLAVLVMERANVGARSSDDVRSAETTLPDAFELVAAHLPAERGYPAAYGRALDWLLERSIVGLSPSEAVVMLVPTRSLRTLLAERVLASDSLATAAGVGDCRVKLRGILGV